MTKTDTDDRFLTLQELADDTNKKLKGEFLILGSRARQEIPRLTTGILAYDLALGGGWAKNQWNEIIGNESSGKTAIAYETLAANQALDPDFLAMWVAAEEFVPSYAKAIGVDLDRVWVVETNEMEIALNLVLKAIENRAVDCVVIDSIPTLVTNIEVSKSMDENSIATGAKMLSNFFKKCAKAQRRSLTEDERGCTMLAINQWRDSIGVMFGDPRTTPGGKAKNYYFFTRIDLTRSEWITEGSKGENRVGQTIKMRVMKNKTYRPSQTAEVDFYFADTSNGAFKLGEFDTIQDIVNVCAALGVIERHGARYDFDGQSWKGKDCLKTIITPEVRADIDLQKKLRAAAFDAVLANSKSTMPISLGTEEDAEFDVDYEEDTDD